MSEIVYPPPNGLARKSLDELNVSGDAAELENIRYRKVQLQKEISALRAELQAVQNEIEAERKKAGKAKNLTPEEEERQKKLQIGRKKFNMKPEKGIDWLVENQVIEMTPDSVAKFLLEAEFLNKTLVGDYLGEGKTFNMDALTSYVNLQDFADMTFDNALRKFLAGFRLPGEAQKIDRMMERFAKRYCEGNPGIFANPDTAYVLAFSVIMLNTDLHNPNVKNKITRPGFLKNNRGINEGKDLPEAFLSQLYDSILNNEIKMNNDEAESSAYTFSNPDREGYLVKQGGRIKTWKKRWCILTGSCLYYFKEPTDRDPCGIIPLENLTVRDVEMVVDSTSAVDRKKKKGFYFELVMDTQNNASTIKAAKTSSDGKIIEGRHSSYVFQCDTEDEKADWMYSIRAQMSKPPVYTLLLAKRQKVTMAQESDGSRPPM